MKGYLFAQFTFNQSPYRQVSTLGSYLCKTPRWLFGDDKTRPLQMNEKRTGASLMMITETYKLPVLNCQSDLMKTA